MSTSPSSLRAFLSLFFNSNTHPSLSLSLSLTLSFSSSPEDSFFAEPVILTHKHWVHTHVSLSSLFSVKLQEERRHGATYPRNMVSYTFMLPRESSFINDPEKGKKKRKWVNFFLSMTLLLVHFISFLPSFRSILYRSFNSNFAFPIIFLPPHFAHSSFHHILSCKREKCDDHRTDVAIKSSRKEERDEEWNESWEMRKGKEMSSWSNQQCFWVRNVRHGSKGSIPSFFVPHHFGFFLICCLSFYLHFARARHPISLSIFLLTFDWKIIRMQWREGITLNTECFQRLFGVTDSKRRGHILCVSFCGKGDAITKMVFLFILPLNSSFLGKNRNVSVSSSLLFPFSIISSVFPSLSFPGRNKRIQVLIQLDM